MFSISFCFTVQSNNCYQKLAAFSPITASIPAVESLSVISLSAGSKAQMWWSPSSLLSPCPLYLPALWFSWLQRNPLKPNTCSLSAAVTLSSIGWPTMSGTWWGGPRRDVCIAHADHPAARWHRVLRLFCFAAELPGTRHMLRYHSVCVWPAGLHITNQLPRRPLPVSTLWVRF